MEVKAIPVSLRSIMPATEGGMAVFLACEQKTFVIYIDPHVGNILRLVLNGERKERPLTHDLIGQIFTGFEISLDRVLIHHVENSVFYARLFLVMKNELGTKIVEMDARPSDAIVLAVRAKRPILVTENVLNAVDDMRGVLEKILKLKSS